MSNVTSSPPSIPGTTEHWANLEGHRMRYLRAGSGPPLLLIHGLLAYSFSWRFNFSALNDIREILAPDLLGTGFSDRVPGLGYSVEACAHRMLHFMTQLGIHNFDLLGTSHGGGVAATMASLAPERIQKLVLVAPVNPWSRHGMWITRILATSAGRSSFKTIAPRATFMSNVFLKRIFGNSERIAPGTLEGYSAPLHIPGTWDYGLDIVKSWRDDMSKLEQSYLKIESETLLIWGSLDPAVYPSSGYELQRRMRRASLIVLPGVGHLPYEETPGEFNLILRTFLREIKP